MIKIDISYSGRKHCDLTHGPSLTKISTDAPKDNNGLGESFSPTDLVAGALISCMLTVMAIDAEKEGQTLEGSYGSIQKIMQAQPRKIAELPIELHLPKNLSPEWKERLEKVAWECPVKRSLNPDIVIKVQFHYDV